MKKLIKIILAVSIMLSTLSAENKYETNIFTIKSLEIKKDTSIMGIMYLPSSDKFSPNINIIKQSYSGTLEEYQEITENQFKKEKLNVLYNQIENNRIIFEYSGKFGKFKTEMHWYGIAHKKDNSYYLITATALKKQWKQYSKELIDSVQSFKLK